jgi:hypothetical protein
LYFSECLNAVGIETTTWKRQDVSAFDMFDMAQPSLFISHYSLVTNDIIKYLSGNNKIDCVLNITGASQQHVDMLHGTFKQNKIKCPFVFTNQPTKLNGLIGGKIKLISIMHGADYFLRQQGLNMTKYNIELGIVTDYACKNSLQELTDNYKTYHYLTHEESPESDIVSPVLHMYPLYSNYLQTIIAYDEMSIPQSFFDALLYGNEAYLLPRSSQQTQRLSEAVKSVIQTDVDLVYTPDKIPKAGTVDFSSVKQRILSNHTCFHRVKRLLSKLKCSDAEQNIDKLIGEVCK